MHNHLLPNTDNSNKQLRTAFIGALITTLASGLASLVVEETKGYIARKRKRQEEAEAEFRKQQTCKCRKTIN